MGSGGDAGKRRGKRRRLRRPAAALAGGSPRRFIRGGSPAARPAGVGCGSYALLRGQAAQGPPKHSPIAGGAAALLPRPRAAAGPLHARTHAAAPQPPRQRQPQEQPPRAAPAKRFRFKRR